MNIDASADVAISIYTTERAVIAIQAPPCEHHPLTGKLLMLVKPIVAPHDGLMAEIRCQAIVSAVKQVMPGTTCIFILPR